MATAIAALVGSHGIKSAQSEKQSRWSLNGVICKINIVNSIKQEGCKKSLMS